MRSGPSSQPQTGRVAKAPHAAANAGSKRRRENGQPVLRLTPQNAVNTPSTAQMYADDVRGSPSCTGVGVVKLGREGRRFRGVTPKLRQYPSLAAGFRRRALFFEIAATRQIRAPTTTSGHFALARLNPRRVQAPTSPGPWERTIETTLPTGLAVARGQFRSSGQGPNASRNRYRMGR